MILGALVDAGLDVDALTRELRRLPVEGWTIGVKPVRKRGIAALYLDVEVPGEDHHFGDHDHEHQHGHRKLSDVLHILRSAAFPGPVEKAAGAVYHRLAEAEARVHREPIDQIAFHEVGQIDAIVDITGAVLGLFLLGVERVYCSALPCGRGTIHAAHGQLPSPSPATLELLRGVPSYAVDVDGELVTPTGAAILTTIASFEARPKMVVNFVGYGSGRSEFPFPNVLRVLIGQTVEEGAVVNGDADTVTVLEANIDDMNPQIYEHALERLFAAGALDAWTHPVQMKKGRPGTQVCALAAPERADAIAAVLLAETTTIGVRRWTAHRDVLAREIHTIQTVFGPVRIKVVAAPSGARARPEFEDCRAIATRDELPLGEVMRVVEADAVAWLAGRPS